VFTLTPLRPPTPTELALRRAVTRRGKLVIDGNRARRRLISLARWAFPDLWSAFAGSMPTAVAVLSRWPDLRALGSARRSTLTAVVAAHTRGVPDVPARVEAIRAAAKAWAAFWDGHLDLDALAWEVAEHLHDTREADERIARATAQATRYWADLYGDDPLLASVPGMGPMTAPTVRAFLGDGSAFGTAKATASYCPASRSWQDFFGLKGGDARVGQPQVHVLGPVPGDGLVGPDGVVLDPVLLGPVGESDGVLDLVDEQALVLQGPETAFA
jgi:hypothetical protein